MKVYVENNSPLLNNSQGHVFPFAFDSRWIFTTNPNEADIVPLLHLHGIEAEEQRQYFLDRFSDNTRVLVLSLFHDSDDEDKNRFLYYIKTYKNIAIVSTAYNSPYNNVKFYDFLWNRTKGLYGNGTIIKSRVENSPWLKDFSLDIFTNEYDDKNIKYNILCPNRAYYNKMPSIVRLYYRKELHDIVKSKQWHNVLISDPDNGSTFVTNNWKPHYKEIIEKGGTYAPIANKYYQESFISAYVESVVGAHPNIVKTITEKTWEPLLKGHFILPFAAPGIIQELKQRGFKFPDFINYDYADYTNDEVRWQEFLVQFRKIQKLTIDEINMLYKDNLDIINHNCNLFKTLPYDSLYDKIK